MFKVDCRWCRSQSNRAVKWRHLLSRWLHLSRRMVALTAFDSLPNSGHVQHSVFISRWSVPLLKIYWLQWCYWKDAAWALYTVKTGNVSSLLMCWYDSTDYGIVWCVICIYEFAFKLITFLNCFLVFSLLGIVKNLGNIAKFRELRLTWGILRNWKQNLVVCRST